MSKTESETKQEAQTEQEEFVLLKTWPMYEPCNTRGHHRCELILIETRPMYKCIDCYKMLYYKKDV